MATRINPLDYGYVVGSTIQVESSDCITMDLHIKMIFESEEEAEIVTQAIVDKIESRGC